MEILLEIFDTYRQLHGFQPNYKKAWNSRDGWFKLAHVCLHWRRVVFSSSSRLHVCLLFTPWRSSREPFLRDLPRFPILIDYRIELWDTEKEVNFELAVNGHHQSRVRGIAVRSPYRPRVLETLSHPFPELESLEFESYGSYPYDPPPGLDLTATLLSGSAPSLRRLTLQEVELASLIPLLSSTTGLEELALKLWVTRGTHPEVLFIANLQRMSCLCRLEFKFEFCGPIIAASPNPPLPASARDVVPLPRLTDFIFVGHSSYLEILATRLAAPSLRHLDAEYYGEDATSPLPQLCKFINDSECHFKAIRLDLSSPGVTLSADTCSKFDHAEPAFRICIPLPIPWEDIGQMLSGPLSTVEELVIGWTFPAFRLVQHHNIPWHALFYHIPQVKLVKMLQVNFQVTLDVAHALQLDGQEPALDLLPSLEQVEVKLPTFILESTRSAAYVRIRDAFQPLISTRQQVGHPIKLSIN